MRKKLLGLLLLGGAMTLSAQQINPMIQAVLQTYQELLRENPKDYETLYQRGAQYLQLGMLDQALEDLTKAVEYTPAKESAMLSDEYSLLAGIYSRKGDKEAAIGAVNKVLEYNPSSYRDLYRRGELYLDLNDPDNAIKSFQAMQRLKSRSQEAFYGLARAYVQKDNPVAVEEMIQGVKDTAPANATTFCRLGHIYELMGDNASAAGYYLNAFAVADSESEPIQRLFALSQKDFPTVGATLDSAIEKSNNPLTLQFLKANLAFDSGNYAEAYSAFKPVVNTPEGRQEGVYTKLARTALALDKLPEAAEYIAQARKLEPNAENALVKAQIERASGNPLQALASAQEAVGSKDFNSQALLEMALAMIDAERYTDALAPLNEVIMTDAENPEPLMIRAWLNNTKLENPKQAAADYSRVASADAKEFPQAAYKAMAQTLNGKLFDGESTMNLALAADGSKDAAYWAAVYYAQTGDLAKGEAMARRAQKLGYQNLHNLQSARRANLDLAPLHHLLR